MSFSPFIGHGKPHQNGSEPLEQILRKTTTKPLYCHPKEWCDGHLDVLRIEGLDKEYPVDHVLRRPVRLDPSDLDIVNLLEYEEGKGFIGNLMLGLRYTVEAPYTSEDTVERCVASKCINYLQHLRNDVRKYPQEQRSSWIKIIFDFPDYNDYPFSFFPIVTVLCRNHDNYRNLALSVLEEQETKRLIRWKRASKPAEMVAHLIAMAQQQRLRLQSGNQAIDRCCSSAVCPVLIWVTNTNVRFIRGHVPLSYLATFDNPMSPLPAVLKLEISPPMDMLKADDQPQIFLSLTALLDQYFRCFRPGNWIDAVQDC
ncbi:hypothetical protein FQN50_009914 [Emmonsiellopsis sp. PD_5]|nr:hypothetical protein FQN50_009914 [Emmonsiellopsis sp. PD_5]